jgi:hypothetical protein
VLTSSVSVQGAPSALVLEVEFIDDTMIYVYCPGYENYYCTLQVATNEQGPFYQAMDGYGGITFLKFFLAPEYRYGRLVISVNGQLRTSNVMPLYID